MTTQAQVVKEFETTMQFINDPAKGMVQMLQEGHVLDSPEAISQAKENLKDIKLRLEEREDEIRHYKNTGSLENTDGGKQLIARAAMFREWIEVIEGAIKEGGVEIEKQRKLALEKEAAGFVNLAQSNLSLLQGDPEIVKATLHLASLLGDRTLSQAIDPVLESRRKYKIAIRNLTRLRDEEKVAGIPDLPAPPADDGLSEAFNKFRTIDFSVGNRLKRRNREIKKAS